MSKGARLRESRKEEHQKEQQDERRDEQRDERKPEFESYIEELMANIKTFDEAYHEKHPNVVIPSHKIAIEDDNSTKM
jgi:broad specificity phosphatase PhoE